MTSRVVPSAPARISPRFWVQFTWAAMLVRAASSVLRVRLGNLFPPASVIADKPVDELCVCMSIARLETEGKTGLAR